MSSESKRKYCGVPMYPKAESPEADKENFSSKGVRVDGEATVMKSVKFEENIRKQYETKGAIPKRFGQRHNNNNNDIGNQNTSKLQTSKAHDSCLSQKNDILPSESSRFAGLSEENAFPQTKFHVLHEDHAKIKSNEPRMSLESDEFKLNVPASSTLLLDEENEGINEKRNFPSEDEKKMTKVAFKKAKDFFLFQEVKAVETTQNVQLGKEKISSKNALFLGTGHAPFQPLHSRIKQLKNEMLNTITPHDVLPPQPKKIKVSHKEAAHGTKENRAVIPAFFTFRDRVELRDAEEFMKSVEEKDKRRSFSPNYRGQNASTHNRQAVVSFIIRRGSNHALSSYLIYQAVRIFDDMLQSQLIPPKNLQLVMITALWIAMKKDYLAPRIPSAQKMASFSDGSYTKKDVLSSEKNILTALGFNFSYPDIMSVLSYYTITQKYAYLISDEQYQMIYYSGGYMIELALLDEELMITPASLLAASAAELSAIIVMEQEEFFNTAVITKLWRAVFVSRRYDDEQMSRICKIIIRDVIESTSRNSPLNLIYKKYSHSRYGRVSSELVRKIQKFNC